jgi:hypothetical protein
MTALPPTDLAAVIAGRPSWRAVELLRCMATGCGELAVVEAPAFPGRVFCGRHAELARRLGRRTVPLVVCTRCRRQAPIGLVMQFDGEHARRVCRDCAELVRDLLEEHP